PAVPADLAAVIDRMLRPAPGDRFAGLDEVRDRLAAVAGRPPGGFAAPAPPTSDEPPATVPAEEVAPTQLVPAAPLTRLAGHRRPTPPARPSPIQPSPA